jgi:hypothetical protein
MVIAMVTVVHCPIFLERWFLRGRWVDTATPVRGLAGDAN